MIWNIDSLKLNVILHVNKILFVYFSVFFVNKIYTLIYFFTLDQINVRLPPLLLEEVDVLGLQTADHAQQGVRAQPLHRHLHLQY